MSKPVAIVSGGTFGLGREIALHLAATGYDVVAFGLRSISGLDGHDTLTETEAELAGRGLKARVLEADVSDEASVNAVIEQAALTYGRVDCLVANAAIGPLGTVLDTAPDLWDRIMAVNLKGTYLCSRAVIPKIKAGKRGGSIIIIGSGAGWGKPNMAAYAASKGGLAALAQSMAYDHFHDGIRVNTVIPGGGGIVGGISLARVDGEHAKLGAGAPGTAAGRPTNGADMAAAVAFLLSKDAEAISGTVLDVGCFFHQGGPVPRRPAPVEE
jgi:NAD(P)-dependent dehydrogenase (short-subunit alcohol dehydrogenase family)